MCTLVFIAADHPLATIAWNPAKPAFHVRELTDQEHLIRGRFSKPYVYYVGAHELCGCGFRYGLPPEQLLLEPEEEVAARDSVRRLAAYLTALVAVDIVELYACASEELRDVTAAPSARAPLSVSTIGGETFSLVEGKLLTIAA